MTPSPAAVIRVLLVSLLFAVVLGGAFFLYLTHSRGNVIVYDGESFTPSEMIVSLGEPVIFENKSGVPFWPASNLHPSHLQFVEFDPKVPVAAGETWSFTFTRAGNWEYHDHINPTVGGVVRVRNASGELIDPNDCTIQENQIRCWEKDVKAFLTARDIEGAFTYILGQENESSFLQNCHGLVHLIGESAYDLFSNGENFHISQKSTFCGYGFYHGFMETLLTTTGDLQEALDFCAYVDNAFGEAKGDARNACYHGIGHGAVDGSDPRTWGDAYASVQSALQLCEKVTTTDAEEIQCGGGVFDGLVTAYSEQSFGFSEIPEDFYDLCTRIDNLNFKEGCYRQMNPLTSYLGEGDIQKTFDFVRNIKEPEFKDTAIRSVIGTFARNDMDKNDYEMIIDACYSLDDDLHKDCLEGFVSRLMEYGSPETGYLLGINFCSSDKLQGHERTICFGIIPSASITHDVACESIAQYIDINEIRGCLQDL